MGIKRIEADPQAIVETTVVVPFTGVGDGTIQRDVAVETINFGKREPRLDDFHRNFLDWFSPSIESVVESESRSLKHTMVGYPTLRTVCPTTEPANSARIHVSSLFEVANFVAFIHWSNVPAESVATFAK
jgi:hypothetical protein